MKIKLKTIVCYFVNNTINLYIIRVTCNLVVDTNLIVKRI